MNADAPHDNPAADDPADEDPRGLAVPDEGEGDHGDGGDGTDPSEGIDLASLDLGMLLGGEPGPSITSILEMAQQLQAGMIDAQAEAAATVVEGVAGGGAVRIEATAGLEFQAVHLRPDAVDPDDVELLEDLVLAALRDLVVRANEVQTAALGGLGGMLPDEP